MSNSLNLTKEQLIEKIQYVYETDVGDFKRKTALYLNRFSEAQTDSALKRKIRAIRDSTLYKELSSGSEMEKVDRLRFALLEQLRDL